MATFENIRFCKKSEYKYFEEERRNLSGIEVGELCVAMFLLEETVNKDENAVVLPVMIVGKDDQKIEWMGFNHRQTLTNQQKDFTIVGADNYIRGDNTIVLPQRVGINIGYLRDHVEGIDGTPLEIRVADEIPASDKLLVAGVY